MKNFIKWSNDNQGIIAIIAIIVAIFLAIFSAWILLGILVLLLLLFAANHFSRIIFLKHRKLQIINAIYGSGTTYVNITDQLNELVTDNKLNTILSNGIYGKDPIPGKIKIGKIKYEFNKKIMYKKYKEGDAVNLP